MMKVISYLHAKVLVGSATALLAMGGMSARGQSLDDQLFEDLKDPDPIGQTDVDDVARKQFEDSLRKELAGKQRPGEDVDAASGSPLTQTIGMMNQVRDRLAVKDTAAETRQLQKEIVGSLDKLIEQLSKKKKQSGGGGQSGGQKKPKPKNKQPNPKSSPGGSKKAPQQKTAGTGAAKGVVGDASQDQLMQASWGNLPPNVKQEMQSARPEKFLPKYSRLIEEYFRRLAEENQ